MATTLTLNGADITAYLRADTLDWADQLNARGTLSFTLRDLQAGSLLTTEGGDYLATESGARIALGTVALSIGAEVRLEDNGTAIFGGTVDRFGSELVVEAEDQGAMLYLVSCVSFDQIADRRLVAGSYETPGQTLADIVGDIVADVLVSEGIDTAGVATGPAISPVKWNYQAIAKAFNDLSDLTGYHWWIDADKVLWFQPRTAIEAPFTITSASGNFRNLRVETTRQDYRNRQYVKAGYGLTPQRTETIKGDGTRKVFTLAYPAGTEPSIPTKTFGIRGVETGQDWYWQKDDPNINQDDGATALANGATLDVTYQGLYPILVNSQVDAEITARAAAEGGSGIYEAITDEPNLDDEDSSLSKADGLLRRYGRIPRTATFETDTPGLAAGQLLKNVDVPEFDIEGDWLIASVSASDVAGVGLRYQVTAWDGEALGGWVNFFAALANNARTFEFRDNEVIILLRRTEETVSVTDSVSYTTPAPESRVGFAVVGYCEVA